LGYEQRAEQEIESALRVITANLDTLSDQDRSLAVRGFRGYLKGDVTDEVLKLDIETFVASQLEAVPYYPAFDSTE
jgi:hypothetical protein